MRINALQNINFNYINTPKQSSKNKVSFNGFPPEFYKEQGLETGQYRVLGNVVNSYYTCYVRSDINWRKLGEYISEKFPKIEDVNIDIFGCSNGEEAYSLYLLLKENYPKSPVKINAYDINNYIILKNKAAQKSGRKLNVYEMENITAQLGIRGIKALRYFDNLGHGDYKFNEEAEKSINFETANILTSLDLVDGKKPSIFFCRNMWPNIRFEEYEDFAKALYQKLAPGSIVVIGSFDRTGRSYAKNSDQFPTALLNAGFKNPTHTNLNHTPLDIKTKTYVFEK